MKRQKWLSELEFTDAGEGFVSVNQPLKGRAVAIVGGGPSLDPAMVPRLAGVPVLYANNAFMLAPEPSLVLALDRRWFDWHGAALAPTGHLAVTAVRGGQHIPYRGEARFMRKCRDDYWPPGPDYLAGKNSGHAAISLAISMGATRIYLFGFDMAFAGERTHWHETHRVPPSEQNYTRRFRPDLEALVRDAPGRGIRVATVTPSQAKIPAATLAEALENLADETNRMDHPSASAPVSE